jgi:hypothetical protein
MAHRAGMASLEKPWEFRCPTRRLLGCSSLIRKTIRIVSFLGLLCTLLHRLLDFSSTRPTIRLLALVGLASTPGLGWIFPWARCLGTTMTSNSKTGLERESGRDPGPWPLLLALSASL